MKNPLLIIIRRWPLWSFWLGLFVVGLLLAVFNSLTTGDDLTRNQVSFKPWEPFSWELTSFFAIYLLFFVVFWLTERKPLFTQNWLPNTFIHVLASVLFSVTHVMIMVALRQMIYASQGMVYDFGDWSQELLYEYRKDVVTYFVFVLSLSVYNWALDKFQQAPEKSSESIRFKNKSGWHRLLLTDICTIESGGNYVYFNTKGQVYANRATMKQMSEMLNGDTFMRIHRSFIVNINHIKTITELDKDPCSLILRSGKAVPVSRKYRQALLDALQAKN
ncbi:LytTR family DNA-binding domain-containing protein [Marinicella sp. S1101]|uniref:LytR/AlgR family response regulator transcription factor n=1 Tax=Marinicella marina TaxID=2996016 RepID=UPI002260967A|nr:LytTR family DNA-binding domain-containing protein [Marinicella marina]MCX7553135.1 LytTR family DNA-binding domain-containing protein [Marinicella marina]MDJ1138867.1 LytTR family DNA-binding domain-containing protein [Marinicella marina]